MGAYYDLLAARAGISHYWKFDNDGEDSIGTADLTLSGGQLADDSIVPAETGSSRLFSGSGQGEATVTVGTEFAILFWYNSPENSPSVLCSFQPTNSIVTILIESGNLILRVNNGTSTISTPAPTAGVNHMVAACVEGDGTSSFWVDGVLIGSTAATHYTDGTYTFDVGHYGDFGGGYYHVGNIDEIAIIDGLIDTPFVEEAYLAGLEDAPAVPLSAGTLSDDGQTATTASLSWTDSTGGTGTVTQQLQRSLTTLDDWNDVGSGTSSPFIDTGLTPETGYDYRVAYTDDLTTEVSNTVTITTEAAPSVSDADLHLRLDSPLMPPEIIGSGYLRLFGQSGQYASTPDSAALSITGDLDVRAKVNLTANSGANQTFVSKGANSSNAGGYTFWLANTGVLRLYWSTGAAQGTASSSVSLASTGDQWVRVTLDVDNGASAYEVKFFTSTDGTTWTQLGTTQTGGATTSIGDNAISLAVGAWSDNSAWINGKIYRAIIKNGIDGTTVFDADFTALPAQTRTFAESSANAATVTINGNSTGGQFAHGCLSFPTVNTTLSCSAPGHATYRVQKFTAYVRFRARTMAAGVAPRTLMSQNYASTPLKGWRLYLNTTTVQMGMGNGTTYTFPTSSAHGLSDGQVYWLKVVVVADNGSGNRTVDYYKSGDDTNDYTTATWSLISGGVVAGGAVTIAYDANPGLYVGSNATSGENFTGDIFRTVLEDNTSGAVVVFDRDFTNLPTGTANFLESSANAAVVTVNGPLVADSTTNVRDGIAVNGVVFGASGKVGGAGTFDGVNDYGEVNAWTYGTSITVSGWFKVSALTGVNQVLITNQAGTAGFTVQIAGSTSKLAFLVTNATTNYASIATNAVVAGTWYHFAGTFDGTNVRLYVDGVAQTPTTGVMGVSANPIRVGAWNSGGSANTFYGGLLDDLRIYSSALSADDIVSLMATASPIIKPKSLFTF